MSHGVKVGDISRGCTVRSLRGGEDVCCIKGVYS